MNRRLIAATVLSVLLVLSGIDFLEDTGLIQHFNSQVDKSLDDTLNNYGEIIRPAQTVLSDTLSFNLHDFEYYALPPQEHRGGHGSPRVGYRRNLSFAPALFDPLTCKQVFLL